MTNNLPVDAYTHWADLVIRIREGDSAGAEDLYHTVSGSARAKLRRSVDPHLVEDRLHDIVVTVLEAIRGGTLREPERLMGFVRTVTHRQVAAHIRSNVARRRRLMPIGPLEFPTSAEHSPEAAFAALERTDAVRKVLRRLRARDREILIRFYCEEQDQQQICQEMNLTATQFRLYKSRAIARCSFLARRGVPAKKGAVAKANPVVAEVVVKAEVTVQSEVVVKMVTADNINSPLQASALQTTRVQPTLVQTVLQPSYAA